MADKKTKVDIVGFASSSRDLARYGDPDVEIWVLNELYRSVPRWDRLFEVHKLDYLKKFVPRDGNAEGHSEHYNFMAALPGPDEPGFRPVYMVRKHDDFKAGVAFDPVELAKTFMYEDEDPYFTSTPAYMVALALREGFTDIGVYGIDLLQDEEYAYQRPCMEFLIGWARGSGRRVYVPRHSALLKANYLYGVTDPPSEGVYTPLLDFLSDQHDKHQAQFSHAEATRHAEGGAVQMLELVLANTQDQATKDWANAEIAKHRAKFNQAEATRHTLNGVLQGLAAVKSWGGHLARGGSLGTDKPAAA